MRQEEEVLFNRCCMINNELSRLLEEYGTLLVPFPNLLSQLRKAENRSKEFENGSFIVLVVGPVKSGKSTLVNLIAQEYVSPTHFLECTVRPSIISQKKPNEDSKIVVYTSEGNCNKVEQIDSIIDIIRGVEDESVLSGVSSEIFELNRANIKSKVELDLKASLSSETLLTVITTPGGKLMQQQVYIIDMPGFDGGRANIDNPIYDAISQRADLIIFVQSSNSAISKVSEEFLSMLRRNNQDVPVCLVHNEFESAYWRSHEEKKLAVNEQMQYAKAEIRRQGFNIHDDQCFCINLGKVEDARKSQFNKNTDLQNELEKYNKIEEILYERVINNRDAMRLMVCLSRTATQIKKLIDDVHNEIDKRNSLSAEYDRVVRMFDDIRTERILTDDAIQVNCNIDNLKSVIANETDRRILLVQKNLHLKNHDVREMVEDYLYRCEDLITKELNRSLSLPLIEEKLHLLFNKRIDEIRGNIIKANRTPITEPNDRIGVGEAPRLELVDGIESRTVFPHKLYIPIINYGGHSSEDLVGYFKSVKNSLIGTDDGTKDIHGYLETTAIPPIIEDIKNRVDRMINQYADICVEYLNKNESMILSSIIPDKESFDSENKILASLLVNISNIDTKS